MKEVEPQLFAEVCKTCSGRWISSENYEQWLTHHGERLPVIESAGRISVTKFELARICPKDGRILIKYSVGPDIPFRIDVCGGCGGIWLDRNEWEILKSRNLHDELRNIFTDHWQDEIHRAETRNHLEEIYREKFGAANYEVIREFKGWIDRNEHKSEILAFLSDPNPFRF